MIANTLKFMFKFYGSSASRNYFNIFEISEKFSLLCHYPERDGFLPRGMK